MSDDASACGFSVEEGCYLRSLLLYMIPSHFGFRKAVQKGMSDEPLNYGEKLTEYVTSVVLLGATVVALPEAVLLPDTDAVADAALDEPEDCACV